MDGLNRPETVELLRAHKRRQARIKAANRTIYADHGLVFAKEWENLTGRHGITLGHPPAGEHLGQNQFRRLIREAPTLISIRKACGLCVMSGAPGGDDYARGRRVSRGSRRTPDGPVARE